MYYPQFSRVHPPFYRIYAYSHVTKSKISDEGFQWVYNFGLHVTLTKHQADNI